MILLNPKPDLSTPALVVVLKAQPQGAWGFNPLVISQRPGSGWMWGIKKKKKKWWSQVGVQTRSSSPSSCPSLRPHLTTSFSGRTEGRDRCAKRNTRQAAEKEATETGWARKVEEKLKGPDRGKRREIERMQAGGSADRAADSHMNTVDALFAQV